MGCIATAIDPSSPAIAAGQAVACIPGKASPSMGVTLANTAALSAGGIVLGVCMTLFGPSPAGLVYQDRGSLSASIKSLGAGAAGPVGLDASGNLVRVLPGSAAPLVGRCDTSGNVVLSQLYPLLNPSSDDTTTWGSSVYGSGVTYARTLNVAPEPIQTTPSAYSAIVIATIPLPGTTGAPCSKGGCSLVYDVDVVGALTSGGTAVGGRWMGTIAYAVQTSGSPLLVVSSQGIACGTASSGTALPSGWTLAAQLDGGSDNIELVLTTDALGTYTAHAIGQAKYTQ